MSCSLSRSSCSSPQCGSVSSPFLLTRAAGKGLAADYPAKRPPSGQRFILEWAKVGAVYYRHCLTIYRAPEGILSFHLADLSFSAAALVYFMERASKPAREEAVLD